MSSREILINTAMHTFRTVGLHPLTAFGMIVVDWMLFAAEGATLNAAWPVSIGVAIALTVPCILLQRYGYKDSWGLAIGKGMIVGVLTAIPTPLPSVVSLTGGALGTTSMLLGDGKSDG